jgi:hypothetical protein
MGCAVFVALVGRYRVFQCASHVPSAFECAGKSRRSAGVLQRADHPSPDANNLISE